MSACGAKGWWQATEHAALKLVCIKESHSSDELHGTSLPAFNAPSGSAPVHVLLAWSDDLPVKEPGYGARK